MRIAIVGAGVIGLSCAWNLSSQGARVSVFDKGVAGRGASWAAAGMLSPAYEAGGEFGCHPKLFDLCLQSADMWPAYADRLALESGENIGFVGGPSLAIAQTDQDLQHLSRIATSLDARGLNFDRLEPGEALKLEPTLSKDLRGALRLPMDGQVDNRKVVGALIKVCKLTERIELFENHPAPLLPNLERDYDHVIVTAGYESPEVIGDMIAISAVGGQMCSVSTGAYAPRQTLRCGSLYIVPKMDRIVIGATVEPGRTTLKPDHFAVGRLREEAKALVPGLAQATHLQSWSGVRPATPDGAPLLHRLTPKTMIAAGHYRNGILLAPITAAITAKMLANAELSKLESAFTANRFCAA